MNRGMAHEKELDVGRVAGRKSSHCKGAEPGQLSISETGKKKKKKHCKGALFEESKELGFKVLQLFCHGSHRQIQSACGSLFRIMFFIT